MSEPTTQADPVLDAVLGTWTSEEGETVEITSPSNSANDIKLRGRHDDWTGTASRNGEDNISVRVRRRPRAGEMGEQAPDWAREQVTGTLEWELELQACPDCHEQALRGSWYRGVVRWEEEKDESTGDIVSRTARSDGRGDPLEVAWTRSRDERKDEDLETTTLPLLVVRPEGTTPGTAAQTLCADQPFFIDLYLPRDQTPAGTVSVAIETASGNRTSVTLRSDSSGAGPRVWYTFDMPVSLASGGAGGAQTTIAGFTFTGASGGLTNALFGGMRPVKTESGEVVSFSYGDVSSSVAVFPSWVQQGIAAVLQTVQQLEQAFQFAIMQPLPMSDREVLHQKQRAIANLRVLLARTELTDQQRYGVCESYIGLLTRWGDETLYPGGVGLTPEKSFNRSKGEHDPHYDVVWTSGAERYAFQQGLEQGRELFKQGWTEMWAHVTMGLYQAVLTATGAENIVVAFFSMNAHGEPVDQTARVLSGISLASQGLLTLAGPAARFQRTMKELEQVRGLRAGGLKGLGQPDAWAKRPPAAAGGGPPVARRPTIQTKTGVKLYPVPTQQGTKWLPYADEDAFLPGGPDVIRKVGKSPTTDMQFAPDECGLMMQEGMCRSGRPNRPYGTLGAERAAAQSAGHFNGGMFDWQLANNLRKRFGAGAGCSADFAGRALQPWEMARNLAKGRQIAVVIRNGPSRHWFRVEGFERIEHKAWVRVGDPWNGQSWRIRCDVFQQHLDREWVIAAW